MILESIAVGLGLTYVYAWVAGKVYKHELEKLPPPPEPIQCEGTVPTWVDEYPYYRKNLTCGEQYVSLGRRKTAMCLSCHRNEWKVEDYEVSMRKQKRDARFVSEFWPVVFFSSALVKSLRAVTAPYRALYRIGSGESTDSS